MEILGAKRQSFINHTHSVGGKQIYYLSMEFLMGRSLKTSIYNLELADGIKSMLKQYDINLDKIYENEPDAGLGNGGLGRLAACYLDGLATMGFPAMGYSICYEYGIFQQKLEDGWQTELPDNWLPGGSVWLVPKPELSIDVHFEGDLQEYWDNQYHYISHVNYNTVVATPYDMYVSGYGSEGVSVLRLWSAKAPNFDMEMFNKGNYESALAQNSIANAISKILYPNDNHLEGKSLRLRQQYFLCAASIGDIVNTHMNVYGTLENLADKVAIHINDTHPTLAIPELMRILLDDCGYSWEKSWDIVTKTFAYTNHTVMAEALEKWDNGLMKMVIPEVYAIIERINDRQWHDLKYKGVEEHNINAMRIMWDGKIHMARLAMYVSSYVNGVAWIHTEILKNDVLKEWYWVYPERFQNKTNGITQRRWLGLCNPELASFITDRIGSGWLKDMSKMDKLDAHINPDAVKEFNKIKYQKKKQLAAYVKKMDDIEINPKFIFDIQVKRLHEYKRQLLNAFSIMWIYFRIKSGQLPDFQPTCFIFGAKAAPGYKRAKAIIKYINEIANLVNNDPDTKDKLQVVFVSNYNVSYAEKLVVAADISEQTSTAGTEASGTGNMKFMFNGAVTLGTYDGANVEITQQAGEENEYIFGGRVEDIERLKKEGYDARALYNSNPMIKRVVDTLIDGTFNDNGAQGEGSFAELHNALINGTNWHHADHYFLLYDLQDYVAKKLQANKDYKDRIAFGTKCLKNIAHCGTFSSDRTILQYAEEIWKVK